MRQGYVYVDNTKAGIIQEDDDGDFIFRYLPQYLNKANAKAVSLTLPLQQEDFKSKKLFPFFDGLIPEGWLLDLSVKNWKLQHKDRMGLLLATCYDCIGNVSIEGFESE